MNREVQLGVREVIGGVEDHIECWGRWGCHSDVQYKLTVKGTGG